MKEREGKCKTKIVKYVEETNGKEKKGGILKV